MDNPLVEVKLFSTKSGIASGDLPKMRPLTVEAFSNWLGITGRVWNNWKTKSHETEPYFAETMELIEQNINDQLFQGAATDLLNAAMVTRKLGLIERTEVRTASTAEVSESDQERHMAIHIHPDDPDPLDLPRPLFSLAQLESGVGFSRQESSFG
jgi:hypothetical protein